MEVRVERVKRTNSENASSENWKLSIRASALFRGRNGMTGGYSESVESAPEFLNGALEEGRINVLLDPEQEVNSNGEIGYDAERGLYDRRVLEKVSDIARDWEHGWHQHAELLFQYADGDVEGVGEGARRQLSEIIDREVLTGKSFDYLDEESSNQTPGMR